MPCYTSAQSVRQSRVVIFSLFPRKQLLHSTVQFFIDHTSHTHTHISFNGAASLPHSVVVVEKQRRGHDNVLLQKIATKEEREREIDRE
jgi:hypothetical protein